MPDLWKARKGEIKAKQQAIKLEARRNILKERKQRKIEKRRNLQEKEIVEIQAREENLSKTLDVNLIKF